MPRLIAVLSVSESDAEGEVRVVEYPGQPFFIGTLFVPQQRSTLGKPHPLVRAFLKVVLKQVDGSVKDTTEH